MVAGVTMPNKNIRRGPAAGGAPSDFTNRSTANDIYIDGQSDRLTHGVGSSGTSVRNVQTTASTNVTSVGNGADQTEDTLQTYSLSGGSLRANGDCIIIQAWGRTGANGDSKDIKLYFGATVVASALASTANAKSWYAYAEVYKTGAGAQLAFGTLQVDATAGAVQRTTPAETETAAITIKTTGKENTANTANSILSDVLSVDVA
jgi:hypothetical protein